MNEQVRKEQSSSSLLALPWLFFFLADIQTGLGPFLAAYLAAHHWDERTVGLALTSGGLMTVALSPFAGAWVDGSRNKRSLIAIGTGAIVVSAVLLTISVTRPVVFSAQMLIGAAGALLLPTMAAITLGLVGQKLFDRQFGVNQAFNSAGNVFSALTLAAVSWWIGLHAIFLATAVFAIPVWLCLRAIRKEDIDDAAASSAGETSGAAPSAMQRIRHICADRILLTFFACGFLFHLANAAMLPQLGEMLTKGNARMATPFMSACIIVTQVVIAATAALVGRTASSVGRKPLLLVGFGVLPVRGLLYTLVHGTTALIAVQALDGVANAIFGVVSILLVADRMRGTGHFNFAQGALATCVGLGAALSTTLGGTLIHRFNYNVSFLGLAGVAALGFVLLLLAVPETLPTQPGSPEPAQC